MKHNRRQPEELKWVLRWFGGQFQLQLHRVVEFSPLMSAGFNSSGNRGGSYALSGGILSGDCYSNAKSSGGGNKFMLTGGVAGHGGDNTDTVCSEETEARWPGAARQQLCAECSKIDHFSRDASGVLSCPFWTVLQCGAPLPIHTFNYCTVQSVVPGSELGVCLSVTLLIVDKLQFCVCCIRSGETLCTRLMMRYLDRMCQCGLHAVPWSHISILMPHLDAEPRAVPQEFVTISVSLWNDLANPVFYGVGLAGFKSRANASLLT